MTALKITLLTYKYTTVYRNNVTEVGSSTMIARLQIIAIGKRIMGIMNDALLVHV